MQAEGREREKGVGWVTCRLLCLWPLLQHLLHPLTCLLSSRLDTAMPEGVEGTAVEG